MKKSIWLFIICFFCLSAYFISQSNPDNHTIKVVCILKCMDTNNGFWQTVMAGAELAGKEYSLELKIYGPEEEGNYEAQNQIIEDVLKQKPDAIVLAPEDYIESCDAARLIKEQNIKLVLIDSRIEEDIADAVIATNNYQAGIRMGALMKQLLHGNAKIGIVSHVKGTSTAIDREEGIKMGLNDKKDSIVETVYCESNYEMALKLTKDMLIRHPDITLIAGVNQYSSVGAGKAVKELGLEKSVKIIGFDNAKEQIKYLEEGIYEAIVIQKSFNMGYLGVETAAKLVQNQTVEKETDSGSILITKENMFSGLNQRLLFPFVEN